MLQRSPYNLNAISHDTAEARFSENGAIRISEFILFRV